MTILQGNEIMPCLRYKSYRLKLLTDEFFSESTTAGTHKRKPFAIQLQEK